jgi:molybdopterin molybdotransferase
MATELLPFAEARARLLADVPGLPAERIPLASAAGRVLEKTLHAAHPLPGFDHSAMDGYALATADLPPGAGPFQLRVVGESSAGQKAPELVPGAACRIFTGAAIPERADAVVMQENVRRHGATLELAERPRPRQHIRFAGEDMAAGAVAIEAGTRLSPGALALAAMFGSAELAVARRPRVTLVCTGSELRVPGDPARPASIFESNSAALAALARQACADVRVAPIVQDDAEATQRAFEQALEGTDVLLTVGGVSVGDHDFVRPALERAGVKLDFWRVAIKPGKPLAVGRTAGAFVLGLPGNPASALVTFGLFGMPLLRALQGDLRPLAMPLPARLHSARNRPADRLELVRATLHVEEEAGLVVRPHDNQASGTATSLAHSDGLALIPAGPGPLPAGSAVAFVRWADL